MSVFMVKNRWIIPITLLIGIAVLTFLWEYFDLPSLDRMLFSETGIGGPPSREFRQLSLFTKSVLSSVNAGISAILLVLYLKIYRKTGVKFTIGLILFTSAMLMHSLLFHPSIIQRAGLALGWHIILGQVFTFVALLSILYISLK